MFDNTKKLKAILQREKDLIIQEHKLWIEEQRIQAERAVVDYRRNREKDIADLAETCAREKGEHEHEYHSKQQELGIEIARLEAKKKALEEIAGQDRTTYKEILLHKDEEIDRLNILLIKLMDKQPENITINTKR